MCTRMPERVVAEGRMNVSTGMASTSWTYMASGRPRARSRMWRADALGEAALGDGDAEREHADQEVRHGVREALERLAEAPRGAR